MSEVVQVVQEDLAHLLGIEPPFDVSESSHALKALSENPGHDARFAERNEAGRVVIGDLPQ